MDSTRQNKVSRLIQKELSDIFQKSARELCPGKMITVTATKISPDLSVARSYLSIFPSEGSEESLKNIRANSKQIRYELGKRVGKQLRIVPDLTFFVDDSLDYLENIDNLLK